jgi:hypothetical protein
MYLDTNKELALVTYKQAQRLKELGFDWTHTDSGCKWYYIEPDGKMLTMDLSFTDKSIAAPSVALALKWIRDEKEVKCTVEQRYSGDGYWGYEGRIHINDIHDIYDKTPVFDAYEAAENALLDKLLTILEKENKKL